MRILLVHHAYPPEGTGGSENYTRALAHRLARDHEVSVLHRSTDPARPDHDVVASSANGVRLFSLNNLHRAVPGFEAYRDSHAASAATRVLEDVHPEIVHVGHLTGLSTGIVFEARRRGAAVAVTLHDFWTVCPLGQLLNTRLEVCPGPTPRRCLGCVGGQVAFRAPLARALGTRLPFGSLAGSLLARLRPTGPARIAERLDEMFEVLRAADALLAPSRFLRDRMKALGAPPIEVLPHGHETFLPFPRRADTQGRIRFGFVGAAIPSKGVHVLADAFRRLDDPRALLRVHGPFVPYHGELGYEAQVRTILGPHADESLCGPFPHEKRAEIFAGLDVLIVPSLWEENAPLTVEEAFLAGVPVVVSGHGGLAERVHDGNGGLCFRPADAAELARVLKRFLDEPGLRDRLAAAAPSVTTMDAHVAALERVYDRALRRYRERPGRIGVVVLDRGRPEAASVAAQSALTADVSPRVLIIENGPGPEVAAPAGVEILRLDANRGFGGGMNAGVAEMRRRGCDRILLLNNDAVLAPGTLRRLAEALDDAALAAVGPVIVRESDGRVESRGGRFDPRWGRQALTGHGTLFEPREGRVPVDTLSGAALMLSAAAVERVGLLDEAYFFGFEETEWCLRARRAGLGLAVILGAEARHGGSRTLGPASPERLYYAARNHLRAAERLLPLRAPARWVREGVILALNLAHAVKQRDVPRGAGLLAVLAGASDFRRGRFGPRGA